MIELILRVIVSLPFALAIRELIGADGLFPFVGGWLYKLHQKGFSFPLTAVQCLPCLSGWSFLLITIMFLYLPYYLAFSIVGMLATVVFVKFLSKFIDLS